MLTLIRKLFIQNYSGLFLLFTKILTCALRLAWLDRTEDWKGWFLKRKRHLKGLCKSVKLVNLEKGNCRQTWERHSTLELRLDCRDRKESPLFTTCVVNAYIYVLTTYVLMFICSPPAHLGWWRNGRQQIRMNNHSIKRENGPKLVWNKLVTLASPSYLPGAY